MKSFQFNRQEEADIKESIGWLIETSEEALQDRDEDVDWAETEAQIVRLKKLWDQFQWMDAERKELHHE